MARPKKHKDDVKNSASIRLSNKQCETLSIYGASPQFSIDYLIEWAEENYDLMINNELERIVKAEEIRLKKEMGI